MPFHTARLFFVLTINFILSVNSLKKTNPDPEKTTQTQYDRHKKIQLHNLTPTQCYKIKHYDSLCCSITIQSSCIIFMTAILQF